MAKVVKKETKSNSSKETTKAKTTVKKVNVKVKEEVLDTKAADEIVNQELIAEPTNIENVNDNSNNVAEENTTKNVSLNDSVDDNTIECTIETEPITTKDSEDMLGNTMVNDRCHEVNTSSNKEESSVYVAQILNKEPERKSSIMTSYNEPDKNRYSDFMVSDCSNL